MSSPGPSQPASAWSRQLALTRPPPAVQALAAGGVLALVFLPAPWSFLAPLPLALLYRLIARSRTPGQAFRLGWFGGLAFFALHLFWLPVSFNALFGPVVVVPMLLLPPLLATFWGLTAAATRLTGRYALLAMPAILALPGLLALRLTRRPAAAAVVTGAVALAMLGLFQLGLGNVLENFYG